MKRIAALLLSMLHSRKEAPMQMNGEKERFTGRLDMNANQPGTLAVNSVDSVCLSNTMKECGFKHTGIIDDICWY